LKLPIEEKQNWLNYCLLYIIGNSKSAAWVADSYLHSQKHYHNYKEQIEMMFLEYDNQESVNSPKNLALKRAKGTFIEPFAVFDQNYCGKMIIES
jgi:Fic family protein